MALGVSSVSLTPKPKLLERLYKSEDATRSCQGRALAKGRADSVHESNFRARCCLGLW